MPVYQQYTGGLGDALQGAVQNALMARQQKRALDSMDLDNQLKRLNIATSYPIVPGQSQPTSTAEAPAAPAVNQDALATALAKPVGMPGVQQAASLAPTRSGGADVYPVAAMDRTPGALFENNLTQSFAQQAGAPQAAPAAKAQATNIPGHPANRQPAATSANDFLPTDIVDVPGYGKVDRYGPKKMALYMDAAKAQIDADARIREAQANGSTYERYANILHTQNQDNPTVRGQIAGAEEGARVAPRVAEQTALNPIMADRARQTALATLPIDTQKMLTQARLNLSTETDIAKLHGQIEQALQDNQHKFASNQLTQQQKFAADQEVYRMAGEFVNSSALDNQRARNGIFGNRFTAADAQTRAPSTGLLATTQQRSDWDIAAAALKSRGVDPVGTLGPRP